MGKEQGMKGKTSAGRRQYANETSFFRSLFFSVLFFIFCQKRKQSVGDKDRERESSGECVSFITAERDVIMTRRLFVCGRETERNILLLP